MILSSLEIELELEHDMTLFLLDRRGGLWASSLLHVIFLTHPTNAAQNGRKGRETKVCVCVNIMYQNGAGEDAGRQVALLIVKKS